MGATNDEAGFPALEDVVLVACFAGIVVTLPLLRGDRVEEVHRLAVFV